MDETGFHDLDALAVRRIADFLSPRQLANAARTCHELCTACAGELETRGRTQINMAWEEAVGVSAEAACSALPRELNQGCVDADGEQVFVPLQGQPWPEGSRWDIVTRPYPTADLLQLAAQYAGGWGLLLARRAGFDAGPLPAFEGRPTVGRPTVAACLLLWDIIDDHGKAIWSGLHPLLDVLGLQIMTGADRHGNEADWYICNLLPFGSSLPGSDAGPPWWDTREDVGPHMGPVAGCIMGPVTGCIISTTVGYALRHRVSLLAPGCGELHICDSVHIDSLLQSCFDACPAPGSTDDIDHHQLQEELAEYQPGVTWDAKAAEDTNNSAIADTFDFELQLCNLLYGLPARFSIEARVHKPTQVVRYMIMFIAADDMWSRALDPAYESSEDEEASSEKDSEGGEGEE